MKKSVKTVITVVAVAAIAVMVLPRFLKPKEGIVAAALPVVSVQKPEIGDIELFTALTGSVEPSDIVHVTSKASGDVLETYVKTGDMVKEGQLLCKIDTKQVDGAKISLDTASVSLQDANTNLARMKVLFDSGDISSQQYEQVESSAKMARLQYEGAKLQYDNQVEFSSVTAPISGIVESFNISAHDNVSSQDVLCVISGSGAKAVSFSVTERVVGGLHVGDAIRVEKGGIEYHGIITEVSTMIDESTGLFKIKASVDNADALATGSQVKLYVTSERADNIMLIPTDAIYYTNGEPRVYTYKDGSVQEIKIEMGIYDAESAEVKAGLTASDDVIVTWSSELFNGSKVELASELGTETETAVEETPAADAQAAE